MIHDGTRVIKRIYTSTLAQAGYYIESAGKAAVIDPMRYVDEYIELAKQSNSRILYVFETHIHSDFVSGHCELAEQTGAAIIYGPISPATPLSFPAHIAKHNEVFSIGNFTITVLHTPGHSPDSSCFLLKDEEKRDLALFTGDTLFLGDVGRPDLISDARDAAEQLFDSIQTSIYPLDDGIIVYPGHGAGTSCGKTIADMESDTLGNQKRKNYALREKNKHSFIRKVTRDLTTPPAYFPFVRTINRRGCSSLRSVLQQSKSALTTDQFVHAMDTKNAIVIDTRSAQEYCQGHVHGAISLGLNGRFSHWIGTLLKDPELALLLICSPGSEEDTILPLSFVGFDVILGFLEGGMNAWNKAKKPVEKLKSINIQDFVKDLAGKNILDVRSKQEYNKFHLPNAKNIALEDIQNAVIPEEPPFYIYCNTGYRGITACSLLQKKGLQGVVHVDGGIINVLP